MPEGLENAFGLLQAVIPITNRFDLMVFGSFYCMLLEEWCLSNSENILDCIELFHQQIKDVNEEMGAYSLI